MAKILIVEDEYKLRKELKLFLENNGYIVSEIIDYNNVIDTIKNSDADLVLLDINLPGINGQYICKDVREVSSIPIIIVTSRNTEIDEIISINYGADDFITKPYNTQVLLARMERLLRKGSNNIINYADLKFDLTKSIIIKDNSFIDLSRNENKIIACLFNNKGKIVSRDALINYLWDNDEFVDDNTLTVNINRLRDKLESLGYSNIIVTKRGQGYIIL